MSKLFGNYSTARQLERCAEVVDRKRASLCKNVTELKELVGIVKVRNEYKPGSHLTDSWRANWEPPGAPARPPKPRKKKRVVKEAEPEDDQDQDDEDQDDLNRRSEAVANEAEANVKALEHKDVGETEEARPTPEQDLNEAVELVYGLVDNSGEMDQETKGRLQPMAHELMELSEALEVLLQ